MAQMYWGGHAYTDTELEKVLQELKEDEEQCNELLLLKNKLTFAPPLTKHKVFSNLRTLFLSHNKIKTVNAENIPPTVQWIHLGNNELETFPDFSQLNQLEMLYLDNNRIKVVQVKQLPLGVQTTVSLKNNQISSLPDFSQTKLDELSLCDNTIAYKIHGKDTKMLEPPKLAKIILALENNPIKTTEREIHCFVEEKLPFRIRKLKIKKQIQSLPYLNHKGIEELCLDNNNIKSVNVTRLPTDIKTLSLQHNMIEELSDFSQLTQLETLNLSNNGIKLLPVEQLPQCIKTVSLKNNQVSHISDMSQVQQLQDLNLDGNKLITVHVGNLPFCIHTLSVANNNIKIFPDFKKRKYLAHVNLDNNELLTVDGQNLSPCMRTLSLKNNKIEKVPECDHIQLEHMDLENNKITVIHKISLPESMKSLSLKLNSITIFEKQCFDNVVTYELIRNAISDSQVNMLQQPPPQVFRRGHEALLRYYKDFKESDPSDHVFSSRNRMVTLGPSTAGKSSLTQSLKSHRPVLTKEEDRTHIVDIHHWQITDKDSYKIFDQGGHTIYEVTNQFYIAKESTVLVTQDLTKIDDDSMQDITGAFRRAIHQYPTNQIHIVLTHSDMLDKEDQTKHLHLFQNAIFCVINEESDIIQKLKKDKIHRRDKNQGLNPLYQAYQEMKSQIRFFVVSSKTYEGIPALEEFLIEVAGKKKVVIPQKWVEIYKIIMENKEKFITLKCLEKRFRKLYGTFKRVFQSKIILEEAFACFQYLHDIGLITWYSEHPVLRDYIFHDLEFLIDIMKSLFDHDLKANCNYEKNLVLQDHFKPKELEEAIEQYQNEGLLSFKLLTCLWAKYNLQDIGYKILLEIIKMFNLCYEVTQPSTDSENYLLFLPWFVKNQQVPPKLRVKQPMTINNKQVSLMVECIFYNRIPQNVLEMLCVQLQRYAVTNHYLGERFAWKDGLLVTLGFVDCVARRFRDTIKLCFTGETKHLSKLWEHCTFLYKALETILSQWHGVVKSFHFVCPHCVMLKIPEPHKWHPEQVFPQTPKSEMTCVQCKRQPELKIPEALIVAVGKETSNIADAIRQSEEFLKEHWKETNPPNPLLYLYCESLSATSYRINWTWPECTDEVPITNAVVQYREHGDEQWQTAKVLNPPYDITGLNIYAKYEFRVAGENGHGTGPFVKVTAIHIAEDDIAPEDKKLLQLRHGSLLTMSCLSTVISLLFSRGVIGTRQVEHLTRMLKNDGPSETAEKLLVEVVHRMCSYRQLFLFKKTLQDTGQDHLARMIPVNTTDDDSADLKVASPRASETGVEQALDVADKGDMQKQKAEYMCMYDFEARDSDEVSFVEGDIVTDIEFIEKGWIFGRVHSTRERGMIPSNYLERI